jgi:tetratricopeptide (TPR) repeat protein
MVLAAAVALAAAAPTFAQLDPEAKQPYLWRVVVKADAHPLVTPEFRERLKRDVLAALQTGLGNLGAVEVFDLADLPRDRREPLWQQFDEKGFAALDTPRDLSGAKTHFLRVEYRDGKFVLEARQYDGFTGLSSPLVRAQTVRAAGQVGRAAGLLLDRDFGAVGTVEPIPGKADAVKVLLRGAALAATEDLVRAGDVFALAAVRKTNRPPPPPVRTATGKIVAPPPGSDPPPGLTSTPRDYTLLRVADVAPDGAVRCAVLSRYATALPTAGGVLGYRCMKLGTVTAPVAIRLMASDGTVAKISPAVTVRAADTGFPDPDAKDGKGACKPHAESRQFRTEGPLANVACVSVALGAKAKQFPVPILSADPITIPFDVDPAREEQAGFERAVAAAAAWSADVRTGQAVCYEAVAKLIEKQRNKEALERATDGADAVDGAVARLTDDLARLKDQATRVAKSDAIAALLVKLELNVATLKDHNKKLREHINTVKAVVALENDPAREAKHVQAEALNARIKLLLSAGDVDQALAAYDQLLLLLPDDAQVKARRAQLAGEWKVKDDAHQKARDYLLKTWPAVATVADFKDSLGQLRAAVDVCKTSGDKWTARRLLTVLSAAVSKLIEQTQSLDPAVEADRRLIADSNAVSKAFTALEQDLRAFVGE